MMRDKIQYLELLPGSSINEKELAAEFGVSRTPLREALIRLTDEELVQKLPQRGTYVTKINLNHVRQLTYMRHLLEWNILFPLCQRGEKMYDAVAENLFAQQLSMQRGQRMEFLKYDDQFHELLFSFAGYGFIWTQINNTRSHYNRYRVLNMEYISDETDYQAHLALVRAIENSDTDSFSKILEIHHDCDLVHADKVLALHPDYFI